MLTKNIVLINPHYPYGKDQIYLGGSLVSVAARMLKIGHRVQMVDLNIDRLTEVHVQTTLKKADIIGISLTGSPYIPGVLKLIPELRVFAPNAMILIGGQVISKLTPDQFKRIFRGLDGVIQVGWWIDKKNNDDGDHALSQVLGLNHALLPKPDWVSYVPAWEQMGPERLRTYLQRESALVMSQGCDQQCKFCQAKKGQRESFREFPFFTHDLHYLTQVARGFGITELEFYASSLDFFQNPAIVAGYLEALAHVQEVEGVKIRVRCLSCMDSFLEASREIPNFEDLLHRAGLWCIGFGVDGDPDVWREQKKRQNKTDYIVPCLELTRDLGVTAEILAIMGFLEQTPEKLRTVVINSQEEVEEWPHVNIRPYLAKTVGPGNEGWETNHETVETIIEDPNLFYNLDFCVLGSPITHPDPEHRRLSNEAFLEICNTLGDRCLTSPLKPQGEGGEEGIEAARFNQNQPFDR